MTRGETSLEFWMPRLYWDALGRNPDKQELTLAESWLNNPMSTEDMEDLVWSIAMHPEFQLIY